MFTRSFKYRILIYLLVFLPLSSCGPKYKAVKTEQRLENKTEQRSKEDERTMRAARKRHVQIQSDDTQKRMKQTRSKSKRYLNKQRKKPFYVRWLNTLRNIRK
jgi:hypothetical protein